jgi:hypothetical protein
MLQKVDVLILKRRCASVVGNVILKGRCASVVGNVIHSVTSKQYPTFSVDESRNPNLAVWQMMLKLLCFKDVKSLITCISVFGFVCCFAGYCGML